MNHDERRDDTKHFRSLVEFDKEYLAKSAAKLPRSAENTVRVAAAFMKRAGIPDQSGAQQQAASTSIAE